VIGGEERGLPGDRPEHVAVRADEGVVRDVDVVPRPQVVELAPGRVEDVGLDLPDVPLEVRGQAALREVRRAGPALGAEPPELRVEPNRTVLEDVEGLGLGDRLVRGRQDADPPAAIGAMRTSSARARPRRTTSSMRVSSGRLRTESVTRARLPGVASRRGSPSPTLVSQARYREEGGMSELVFVIEEAPEGGYIARALGESIFTEADTLDELRQQVRDAVACHFEPGSAPAVLRLHFVRDELLAG